MPTVTSNTLLKEIQRLQKMRIYEFYVPGVQLRKDAAYISETSYLKSFR